MHDEDSRTNKHRCLGEQDSESELRFELLVRLADWAVDGSRGVKLLTGRLIGGLNP